MKVVAAQRLLEEDSWVHPIIDKFTPFLGCSEWRFLSASPCLISSPPAFVFLTVFFPKRAETLRIPRQWVLNILKWSNEGHMLKNNGPRTKLGYDTCYASLKDFDQIPSCVYIWSLMKLGNIVPVKKKRILSHLFTLCCRYTYAC